MFSRRHFLQHSALVALSPVVPTFLSNLAKAAGPERDARILVVIQMEGGNDGINTVVPYGDDGYARNRTALRLRGDDLLKLNDHVSLHRAMKPAAQLMEDGRLAIVQGVGYPNPSRSHFRSMEIWNTARVKQEESDRGWVGRAFDGLPTPRSGGPDAIYVGPGELPRALLGRRIDSAVITAAQDLALQPGDHPAVPASEDPERDINSFVRRSVLSAYGTANDFTAHTRTEVGAAAAAGYPDSKLASQLKLVARFIQTGAATRVYYAAQSGYDTHAGQIEQHASLLRQLSGALKAFLDDLKSAKLSDRVVVVAFSEFGRRVAENSGEGTDHGTAGPVLVAGDAVRAGLHGRTPDLTDLQDGDLKVSTDFRQVYAELLDVWLRLPSRQVLGEKFSPVGVLRVT